MMMTLIADRSVESGTLWHFPPSSYTPHMESFIWLLQRWLFEILLFRWALEYPTKLTSFGIQNFNSFRSIPKDDACQIHLSDRNPVWRVGIINRLLETPRINSPSFISTDTIRPQIVLEEPFSRSSRANYIRVVYDILPHRKFWFGNSYYLYFGTHVVAPSNPRKSICSIGF